MAPLAVVEYLDVLSNGVLSLSPGYIAAVMYQFILRLPQKLSIGALS